MHSKNLSQTSLWLAYLNLAVLLFHLLPVRLSETAGSWHVVFWQCLMNNTIVLFFFRHIVYTTTQITDRFMKNFGSKSMNNAWRSVTWRNLRYIIFLTDPFDLAHNLGGGLSRKSMYQILVHVNKGNCCYCVFCGIM